MLSAGGKTGFRLFQTYHIRDHFLLCPDDIFVHGTDWTKKNKKHEKQQHEKLEKEESIDNYKAPGKTDSGQHHVE